MENDLVASTSPHALEPLTSDFAVLRINVSRSHVVAEWSKRLGCTPGELRAAVARVGDVAEEVVAQVTAAQDAGGERAA